MALVNYVKESIAFMEYACDNGLSSNERLLWYALFHIVNMRAQGSNWPDGFISISNKRLLSFLPYSEDSLIKARNRLTQRGVIKYEAGKKNLANPMYALVYFSVILDCYPQNTGNNYGNTVGNIGGNLQGNTGGNIVGNVGGNMTGIIYKPNVRDNDTVPNLDDDVDNDDVSFARATRDAREAVISAFRANVGRAPTAAEADRLASIAINLDVTQFIGHAVRIAAQNGANNPMRYAATVLREWSGEYLATEEELDEYQYLRDAADGRVWDDAEAARKKIRENREERFKRKFGQMED